MVDHCSKLGVTALIPIRNGERYLESFMPQVISNLGLNDEILIINDQSDDGTAALLEIWKSRFPVIRILKTIQPGLVNALNLGLAEASKNWIARFDCDDRYDEFRVRKQISKLELGDVAIFSDYSIVDIRNRNLGRIYSPVNPLECSISLVNSERTAHPSAVFSKEAALSVGGYRNSDYLAEDLSLWLRLSRVGNLRSAPERLLTYTAHSGSITNQNQFLMKKQKNEVLNKIGINPLHLKSVSTRFTLDSEWDDPNALIRNLLHARDAYAACDQFGIPGRNQIITSTLQLIKREPGKTLHEGSIQAWYKLVRSVSRKFRKYS
jgi:glycosyltransferase involved in cell wall biosynthesis